VFLYEGAEALVTRGWYYLVSILTLLRGVKNWPLAVALLARWPVKQPTVELRPNRLLFRVRTFMDVWIIKETCLDRDYERVGADLQDGWNVVDIGAGLGDFTVHAACRCPRGVVYAFEPFPESFALLQENVRLNRLENVRAFPQAVGGQESEKTTIYAVGEAVQHRTARAEAAPAFAVTSISLEQALAEVPQCDFLKMDCEGAEYAILFNASEAAMGKIKRMCLEVHDGVTPHNRHELADYLRGKGFQVKLEPNQVHAHLGFLYATCNL